MFYREGFQEGREKDLSKKGKYFLPVPKCTFADVGMYIYGHDVELVQAYMLMLLCHVPM